MIFNIVIVGVGGQGTLLASKILGDIALNEGYDVRVSEVHGMSQRGGSVVTYVRMSDDQPLYSAIVEQGQAEAVLAFESLEALRALPQLKRGGKMIINTQEILPLPVITGAQEYPVDCVERIKAAGVDTKTLDAAGIAAECGNHRAANVVLLGVLAHELPFSKKTWLAAIEKNVKPQFVPVNREAFLRGYER